MSYGTDTDRRATSSFVSALHETYAAQGSIAGNVRDRNVLIRLQCYESLRIEIEGRMEEAAGIDYP